MAGYPHALPYPSPNFRSPRRSSIDLIVLHTTEGDLDSSLNTLTDATRVNSAGQSARVSSHYLVDDTGIYQLVDDGAEAWHASRENARSIGIEVVGFADAPGTWTQTKIANLANLIAWLSEEYGIPLEYRETAADPELARGIVSHASIDPDRRHDPGMWFPWPELLEETRRKIQGQPPSSPEWVPVIALLVVVVTLAWWAR